MPTILLQTTIEDDQHDGNMARFSLLRDCLAQLRNKAGRPAFQVTLRHRVQRDAYDPVLTNLCESGIDQLWLLAMDDGDGLTDEDCAGINRFRQGGGSLMLTRGHKDIGSSLCKLQDVGAAHHFHSRNPERDATRRCSDNRRSNDDEWPSYHSGVAGDFQRVRSVGSIHPVMRDRHSATGVIQYLPAHPHEGAVSAPPRDSTARVTMEGVSSTSGRRFNMAVAFERSARGGRAIAQSSFQHFADGNWNPATRFNPTGSAAIPDRCCEALRSARQYVRNIAFWLGE